jgi:hypothetical protein
MPKHEKEINVTDPFYLWVVSEQQEGHFMARKFLVREDRMVATEDVHRGDTLEELRAKLPHGLRRLPRWPGDKPHVYETWL